MSLLFWFTGTNLLRKRGILSSYKCGESVKLRVRNYDPCNRLGNYFQSLTFDNLIPFYSRGIQAPKIQHNLMSCRNELNIVSIHWLNIL